MSCKTVVVALFCAAGCTVWADGLSKAEATEAYVHVTKDIDKESKRIEVEGRERKQMGEVKAGEYPHEWPFPTGVFRGVIEICVSPVEIPRELLRHPVSGAIVSIFEVGKRAGAGVLDVITLGCIGKYLYGSDRDFQIWPWGCDCEDCKLYWMLNGN